jgi:hypothetical protein
MSLSAASARRVREAMAAALREQPLDGPWNLLLEDGCTWRTQPRLNRQLLCDLRGHFGGNVIREILLAAGGVKLSRACLSDPQLDLMRGLAERHGFGITASVECYIHRRDAGKGGSSNAIERVAGPGEEGGLHNVYIASDEYLATTGAMLEKAGDDENFGVLLGIPACCREAFIRLSPIASAAQNDFVLLALDHTAGALPYDFWLNYPATYFGPALLSFFPCSFLCPRAAAVARSTFEMLHACDGPWAESFLTSHQTNILYTEYDGLHLFRRPLVDGCIEYGPDDHRSTEPGRLSDLISRGTRLEVRGQHHVLICRESERIASFEGPDIGMCVFL